MFASFFKRLARDEDGTSGVEYAILAGLVAIAVIGGASTLGGHVAGAFTALNTQLGANANFGP